MNMERIERRNLDEAWWNKQLNQCENALVFGHSWFWDALVDKNWTGFYDHKTGAMWQAAHKKLWGLTLKYAQPIWCRPAGLYLPKGMPKPSEESLKKALPKSLRFLELHFEWPGLPGEKKVYQKGRLPATFNNNTLRNLKKNHRHGLCLRPSSPTEINRLFFEEKGHQFGHLKGRWQHAIERLMEAGAKQNLAWFYGVIDQNEKVHAAACFFVYRDCLTYIHGCVTAIGKNSGGMFYLFSEAIKTAEKMGLKQVDFGGSNNPSIASFYAGFGGEDHSYVRYTLTRFPFL